MKKLIAVIGIVFSVMTCSAVFPCMRVEAHAGASYFTVYCDGNYTNGASPNAYVVVSSPGSICDLDDETPGAIVTIWVPEAYAGEQWCGYITAQPLCTNGPPKTVQLYMPAGCCSATWYIYGSCACWSQGIQGYVDIHACLRSEATCIE